MMQLVVFGLTISSTWGNGHATLWRGLIKSLAKRGVRTTFFERDVPYYADTRDLDETPGARLIIYQDWDAIRREAAAAVRDADVTIVTSYCPDGRAASALACDVARGVTIFYDLDTPVTLAALENGASVPYLPTEGLGGFDIALSFTGGPALAALRDRLGAKRVAPLYGHVDPDVHRPSEADATFASDLSYIGTYSQDRQSALQKLFIDAAEIRSDQRFVLAGAQYPQRFPWQPNIHFVRHLAPDQHPSFYAASRMTLNITRAAMRHMGWCPSGRLFEAMACGCAVISDEWPGIEEFFSPGEHLILVRDTRDVLAALDLDDVAISAMREAARQHVLHHHTSDRRADELLSLVAELRNSGRYAAAEV